LTEIRFPDPPSETAAVPVPVGVVDSVVASLPSR
jgi:hypothetical protein